MKKDQKTFKEVAKRCTKFDLCKGGSCKVSNSTNSDSASNSTKNSMKNGTRNTTSNSTGENVSCANCKHYDTEKVCALNLYSEIVSNHNL